MDVHTRMYEYIIYVHIYKKKTAAYNRSTICIFFLTIKYKNNSHLVFYRNQNNNIY